MKWWRVKHAPSRVAPCTASTDRCDKQLDGSWPQMYDHVQDLHKGRRRISGGANRSHAHRPHSSTTSAALVRENTTEADSARTHSTLYIHFISVPDICAVFHSLLREWRGWAHHVLLCCFLRWLTACQTPLSTSWSGKHASFRHCTPQIIWHRLR